MVLFFAAVAWSDFCDRNKRICKTCGDDLDADE
jgi:hypothetical protein